MSAIPWAFLVDVRRGGAAVAVAVVVAVVCGVTKYDRGIYLLMVASKMAASWPPQINLSNSSFLRVLFWKMVVRSRALAVADDIVILIFLMFVLWLLGKKYSIFCGFGWMSIIH